MNIILKICGIICVAIIAAVIAVVLFVRWSVYEDQKTMKPEITYTGLMCLASYCDDYRIKNGTWPTSVDQLIKFSPGLIEPSKDAYGRNVIFVPYNEALGYGEFISYGRDGKPGGSNDFDEDMIIRFPVKTVANAEWNKQVGKQFKASRFRP